ncbi:MAG: hypothetical protein ACD_58C00015G0004 [uncultured bacterium]|nr:MAG: hypothetical protein ACD_58C00015G0004 [uncultured bacterium]
MLSFGIYKKQLLFFLIVIPILIIGGYLISKQFSSASVVDVAGPTSSSNSYKVDINIGKDAKVTVNGVETPRLMHIGETQDLFRYIAAGEEGTYIEAIQITVHLPAGANLKEVKPIIYAVHGVDEASFTQPNSQTIVYNASNISPSATFTVVANLPSGLIEFPFWQRFIYTLANMSAYWWLLISIIPFVAAFLYLYIMTRKTLSEWHLPNIKDELSKPPTNLGPAELAILYDGKVTSKAISAILVDLAHRNYINIINKDGDFSFGKKANIKLENWLNNTNLRDYEKVLLSKIFSSDELASGQKDILFRVSHHVFSRKIAQVYVDIYGAVSNRGFFLKDPVKMYQHYRQFGLILFFVGFFGLIVGLVLSIEPKFFLIFWLMLMFTAMLIIKLAPNLPSRSAQGRKELLEWVKFKNYLTKNEPIDGGVGSGLFEQYLPYAIALGCEVEWAKRFLGKTFMVPNWYISTTSVVLLEDFTAGLYPIISQVSRTLVLSKEPII